jgi:delta8-fatty-acid desaturase
LILGRDATDVILAYHPDWVIEKKMPHFVIGELAPESRTTSKVSTSYRLLDAQIRNLGLYTTDYSFYLREALKFFALWAVVLYFPLAYPGSTYAVLVSAFIAAILWHQGAFVAHDGNAPSPTNRPFFFFLFILVYSTKLKPDHSLFFCYPLITAGHSGITHDQWTDTVLGISLANFMGGLSLGWWKKNHNVHHIVTNHPEHDPDIQHMPFFAVSTRFMHSLFSTYYQRTLDFDAFAKALIPYQHYLFYIVLSFGRFNLYANSFAYVGNRKERVPHRTLEIVGLITFWVWYTFLLSRMESWNLRLMHLLVSHMFTVFLHIQITLSHFGMDTTVVENETYAEMALRTTMDVECPRWMDWFHGGLQVSFFINLFFFFFLKHNILNFTHVLFGFFDDYSSKLSTISSLVSHVTTSAKSDLSLSSLQRNTVSTSTITHSLSETVSCCVC